MIEKHIKRFKENREYVVKQSVKDWIKSNHIKVISVEIYEGTRHKISAEISYGVEKYED